MRQIVLGEESERLMEQIVHMDNLQEAFKNVRRNKGAPGIDGVTVMSFEERLEEELSQLQQEVLNWTYKPRPVKRVEIPKPDKSGVRKLGIPTVRDRVLQTAIKLVLEPIIDPTFSVNSFGFRPGRGQHEAIKEAQTITRKGKKYVVDIDLCQFFDRINHDKLIHRLKNYLTDTRVLRLIGITLRSGIMANGLVQANREGSVQGSPLSPLLSNVVLDELDKELEARDLEFCRYADDCNIFVSSERAGKRVMESLTKFIEKKLKLKINLSKSKVALNRFVRFLGFTITGTAIAISLSSMKRAKMKVKELTRRRTHEPIEQTIKRINVWYRGWSNYYKVSYFARQFNWVEAHLRRRLRARFVAQHKRKRYLYRELCKRGISHGWAAQVYGSKGVWKQSNLRAVRTAWKNDWFHKTMGMYTVFDKWERHWFKRNRFPILT